MENAMENASEWDFVSMYISVYLSSLESDVFAHAEKHLHSMIIMAVKIGKTRLHNHMW